MIRGPIDGKYVELWGIPAWRRKLGIGDESETLTQRIESIISGTQGGPGSVDNANARLAALATLEEAGYVVQTSTFPPAFAGRQIIGVPNRINVTYGTGILGNTVLQTPQDIHDGATPSFQTIKPLLLNPGFVTYVDSAGALASTTITATQLETAVASAAAMDILTTRGDLLSHDGTTYVRVGIGVANTVARTDGLDVLWGKVVLTTDVTGILPVANGGTNASSWTAGSVIFAGAGGLLLAEDNANFFWDNANNRLGLGIALPTALLHLEATNFNLKMRGGTLTSGTYGYLTHTSTGTYLNHNAYATASGVFTADGAAGAASVQVDRGFIALRVATAPAPPTSITWTEGLRVIVSGFVGIGTTVPGVLLDVGLAGTRSGTMRLAGLTSGNVTVKPASIAGTWTLTLPIDDGVVNQFLKTDGAGTATSWSSVVLTTDVSGLLPTANGGTNHGNYTAGSVIFAGAGGTSLTEDNANFFWDDTNNFLGVGTAVPLTKMHLFAAGATDVALLFQNANGFAALEYDGPTAKFKVTAISGPLQLYAGNGLHMEMDGAWNTYVINSGGTVTAFFSAAGNVGIGTNVTAPGALLDLGLAGTTLGVMRMAGSTSGNVTIQPAVAAGTWTLTLPTDNGGISGGLLRTDGAGVTDWTFDLYYASGVLNVEKFLAASASTERILLIRNYDFTNGTEGVSLGFDLTSTTIGTPTPAGTILVGKEQAWSGTAPDATHDAFMSLQTALDSVIGTALQLRSSGSVICGKDSIATNRTDDFTYICQTNGVPTGVPTAFGNRVAMTFDPNTDTFYIYRGGWKGVVVV